MITTQTRIETLTPSRPTVAFPAGGADLLTIGFGTTVAMWAVGYVGRIPGLVVPPMVLGGLLLAILLAGGFLLGRWTGRGWPGGLAAGIIIAMLNLFIVSGTLTAGDDNPSAWGWIPGTLLVTAVLTALAAAVGARFPVQRTAEPVNWDVRFVGVAVAATALLLTAGGLVTGREAGLAVPDWPNSYGYNMFLYPLARMTGNIYYEHAHRLVGVLVGLTTIVLAIHLWRRDDRRWIGWLAVLAVLAVCAQGVMGGLRVAMAQTGGGATGVEVAAAEHETSASTILRVAHGVFGQLFFGLMVAIAVFVSTAWRSRFQISGLASREAGAGRSDLEDEQNSGADPASTSSQSPVPQAAQIDRVLTTALLILLIVQLILGAMLRHLSIGLAWHLGMAMIVFPIAVVAGMRLWGTYGERLPIFQRIGLGMAAVAMVQVGLGFAALAVTRLFENEAAPAAADVVVTTLHQMNGVALLALAVMAVGYAHRLSVRREKSGAEGSRDSDG